MQPCSVPPSPSAPPPLLRCPRAGGGAGCAAGDREAPKGQRPHPARDRRPGGAQVGGAREGRWCCGGPMCVRPVGAAHTRGVQGRHPPAVLPDMQERGGVGFRRDGVPLKRILRRALAVRKRTTPPPHLYPCHTPAQVGAGACGAAAVPAAPPDPQTGRTAALGAGEGRERTEGLAPAAPTRVGRRGRQRGPLGPSWRAPARAVKEGKG